MYDAYGSYNEGFILMGVFITLSGLMLYPIPCIKNTIEKVKSSNCFKSSYMRAVNIRHVWRPLTVIGMVAH